MSIILLFRNPGRSIKCSPAAWRTPGSPANGSSPRSSSRWWIAFPPGLSQLCRQSQCCFLIMIDETTSSFCWNQHKKNRINVFAHINVLEKFFLLRNMENYVPAVYDVERIRGEITRQHVANLKIHPMVRARATPVNSDRNHIGAKYPRGKINRFFSQNDLLNLHFLAFF